MKFKIRQGFVVHHVTYVDVPDGNGGSTREEQRNSYYAGQGVDFDEAGGQSLAANIQLVLNNARLAAAIAIALAGQ